VQPESNSGQRVSLMNARHGKLARTLFHNHRFSEMIVFRCTCVSCLSHSTLLPERDEQSFLKSKSNGAERLV
jgi:hypothetical protein